MTNFTNGYKGITNWTISDIETLTENDAFAIAEGREEIKGHSIYFVDFEGHFGYSALVFAEGRHIYYANDYALHHAGRDRDELHALYLRTLNAKLYTAEEIAAPLADYNDYTRRDYYLRNYYPMRREYESIFCINPTAEQTAAFEAKTKNMTFDPAAFAYFYDADFVRKHLEMMDILEKRREELSDNFDYLKKAYLSEMFNHEYGINWQADYDTLSAFFNVEWLGDYAGPAEYFDALNMTETQRKAYRAARKEYFATAEF